VTDDKPPFHAELDRLLAIIAKLTTLLESTARVEPTRLAAASARGVTDRASGQR
jgi:hypothetical protein